MLEVEDAKNTMAVYRGFIHLMLSDPISSLEDFDSYYGTDVEVDLSIDHHTKYLRSLTLTKLDRPTEAQTDLQSAIDLAQAKQAKDPIDWQNNFNLALYYLAAGQIEESCELYDRASEASTEMVEMAIRDLDDYLMLFPDRLQAREVRDWLSALV